MVYNYNSKDPTITPKKKLSTKHKELLFDSKVFCMLPWIHLHSFPTGEAYPCCNSEMKNTVGNTSKESLINIWNGDVMKDVRRRLLNEEKFEGCSRCYEQEESGFVSMRNSQNKNFGHHIHLVDETLEDGTQPEMKMIYWDIRFSNLCNLRCRSCGDIFSSNWFDDQKKLMEMGGHRPPTTRLHFAGRNENDMWDQLKDQIDNLEQVYFAGGEPLIMEEHYRLLNELIKRGKTDVRLIYNTNFTELTYKKTNVLELWKEFNSVSIGASLDAMGTRAEYIRKNCNWNQIEINRQEMLKICPKVDFYISPTVSILNAWHISDFHRAWVEKGFIKPQDLNINILQDPNYYRIDAMPTSLKEEIKAKWQKHIEWLQPQDHLNRATTGFKSAINFMMADDKTRLLPAFWERTNQLDIIRNEKLLDFLPELGALI